MSWDYSEVKDMLNEKEKTLDYLAKILFQGNVGVDIDHGRLSLGDALALLKEIKVVVGRG